MKFNNKLDVCKVQMAFNSSLLECSPADQEVVGSCLSRVL
jgi:hypothetical protein